MTGDRHVRFCEGLRLKCRGLLSSRHLHSTGGDGATVLSEVNALLAIHLTMPKQESRSRDRNRTDPSLCDAVSSSIPRYPRTLRAAE